MEQQINLLGAVVFVGVVFFVLLPLYLRMVRRDR
jgi:H+/gluconate symporter-like permease